MRITRRLFLRGAAAFAASLGVGIPSAAVSLAPINPTNPWWPNEWHNLSLGDGPRAFNATLYYGRPDDVGRIEWRFIGPISQLRRE